MLFRETDVWRVLVVDFDPAYWCITFRVTHKPTRKWTYARYSLDHFGRFPDTMLLDRDIGGIYSLRLSPKDKKRVMELFRKFEVIARGRIEPVKAEVLE